MEFECNGDSGCVVVGCMAFFLKSAGSRARRRAASIGVVMRQRNRGKDERFFRIAVEKEQKEGEGCFCCNEVGAVEV